MGVVSDIHLHGTTKRIVLASPISHSFHVDQSVSHDGVCLTVIGRDHGTHTVEAVQETLSKTTFQFLRKNQVINLETALTPTTLLDGHIVQGHVDTFVRCLEIEEVGGSWRMQFELPGPFSGLVIPHGSICLNGVSLTISRLWENVFEVAIIPYTYANTNFKLLHPGNHVNVEFDVIGKYLQRLAAVK